MHAEWLRHASDESQPQWQRPQRQGVVEDDCSSCKKPSKDQAWLRIGAGLAEQHTSRNIHIHMLVQRSAHPLMYNYPGHIWRENRRRRKWSTATAHLCDGQHVQQPPASQMGVHEAGIPVQVRFACLTMEEVLSFAHARSAAGGRCSLRFTPLLMRTMT